MLPASNKGVGMNMGFPDPCLTAVGPALVPIPYPNMAMNVLAAPFSPNIFFTMMPALNMGSQIPMTMGDEPGAPNVIFKMVGGWTVGNPKVLLSCLPAINLTAPSHGNTFNNPIGATLVPSVTTVLLTFDTADDDPRAIAERVSHSSATPTIRARLVGGAIGYVAIRVFSPDLPARVHAALLGLATRGMRSLVIDLRGCPGGDADAAIDLASELLPPGAEIVTWVDEDGDETVHLATRSFDWSVDGKDLPITVAVDAHTASAAEIFAGALEANGRAKIVGGPTFGKRSGARVARDLEGALHQANAGTYRFRHG